MSLALGLLVEFVATYIWAPTAAVVANSRSAIAWFSGDATHGDALSLQEVPTEELSSCIPTCIADQLQSKYKYEYLNTRHGRRVEGLNTEFVPLRVFLVKSNILTSIRSYGSLKSTSYIFVTEHPSSKGTVERFKFYHEVAHTSFMGCVTFARRYSKMFSFEWTAFIIATMTPFSLPLVAVIAFFLARAWWAWTGAPIDCEMHADRWALGVLGNPAHAEEVVEVFRAVWREDPVRLYLEYGQRAMMERNFRFWNMEAAVRGMKRIGGTDPKILPLPGRDRMLLMLITYFAAGWAGWHSVDAAGYGLALLVGALVGVAWIFPSTMRLLIASERALEHAVQQRITVQETHN